MSDWLGKLNPEQRAEWDEIVRHAREKTVLAMAESAFVMSLVPTGETDIKFAIELGLAIMMDKPILAVSMPGVKVSRRLRRVADVVVEADPDTEDGRRILAGAIKQIQSLLGEEGDPG